MRLQLQMPQHSSSGVPAVGPMQAADAGAAGRPVWDPGLVGARRAPDPPRH